MLKLSILDVLQITNLEIQFRCIIYIKFRILVKTMTMSDLKGSNYAEL
jgi:hypothetical protein